MNEVNTDVLLLYDVYADAEKSFRYDEQSAKCVTVTYSTLTFLVPIIYDVVTIEGK